MTQILELHSENVKRLRAVHIVPDGPIVTISGANGAGKSSVLDSILYAIAGAGVLPPLPIRDNGDAAETTLKLSDGMVVTRTYTPNGSQLKITAADGSPVSSPQALLDKLTGKTSFDPLAFLRLEQKDQAATLRRLVGLDFTAEDRERKRLYDERTVVNRRLAEMRGAVANMPTHTAPVAEVSSAEVLKQIEAAQAHNAKQVTLNAAKAAAQATASRAVENVKRTTSLIATLEKQLADAHAQLAADQKAREVADKAAVEAESAVTAFQSIDTTSLKGQLAAVESTNAKVRANAARAKAVAEGVAKKAESDALTAEIEAIDAAKAEALKAAQFPVEDLSFEGDVVTFQNLPLSQASSAAQLKVSVAIGAALNHGLRVMLIREGSLLDAANLDVLRQMAEELGVQIWLEVVGAREGSSIIIEDGMVRGAPPVALDTPAPAQASRKRTPKAAQSKADVPATGASLETDNPLLATTPAGAPF